MKKTYTRILSLILALLVISASTICVFAREFNTTELYTSYDKNNTIKLSLKGSDLKIEGVVNYVPDLEAVRVACLDGVMNYYIEIPTESNSFFSATFPLSGVADSATVSLFLKLRGEKEVVPYHILAAQLEKKGSHYEFTEPAALELNDSYESLWKNPARYGMPEELEAIDAIFSVLNDDGYDIAEWGVGYIIRFIDAEEILDALFEMIDNLGKDSDEVSRIVVRINEWAQTVEDTRAELKELGDSIVGKATSDYEKIRLLNYWVAENISYDMNFEEDYESVPSLVQDVIREKRAVCLGYANLLINLIKEQGIPAIGVYCSSDLDDITDVNHIFVEAYVDGRWVIMDPTWDSRNEYNNGKKAKQEPIIAYFDVTPEVFALTHCIAEYPEGVASADDTPSEWAQDEIQSAFTLDLVPKKMQAKYRANITRQEFCEMVINMICRYTGEKSVYDLLSKRGIASDNAVFSDTDSIEVYAANALGIVNGVGGDKFNPDGHLTREQAAAMLMRAASVLGIGANAAGKVFTDDEKISSWAKNGVTFVSGLVSKNGSAVMGGTGDGKFTPKGTYTREQSIVTLYRLFHCGK